MVEARTVPTCRKRQNGVFFGAPVADGPAARLSIAEKLAPETSR
jgi:hypothetical protein